MICPARRYGLTCVRKDEHRRHQVEQPIPTDANGESTYHATDVLTWVDGQP